MTVNRRRFLRSGAMTVLLTGLALETIPLSFAQQLSKSDPSKDFVVPFEAQRDPRFYFTLGTFMPYLDGVFTLSAGAKSVKAKLVGVRKVTPSPNSSSVTPRWRPSDCFVLVFQTNRSLTDLTSVYDVEHAALGRFALFLTRRDGPGGTYFYEAVFNRPLPS